jgi:hypothetical protein
MPKNIQHSARNQPCHHAFLAEARLARLSHLGYRDTVAGSRGNRVGYGPCRGARSDYIVIKLVLPRVSTATGPLRPSRSRRYLNRWSAEMHAWSVLIRFKSGWVLAGARIWVVRPKCRTGVYENYSQSIGHWWRCRPSIAYHL